MGTAESKIGQEVDEDALPSTPISKAKCISASNLDHMDPRSPSSNIPRTPIQVLHVDSPINDDNEEVVNHLSETNLNDPRSPTSQFCRTPIIVSDNKIEKPVRIHNKNLDNARKNIICATPSRVDHKFSKGSSQKRRNSVNAPRLISSNIVTANKDLYKRKSFVGLLETNIDYTETDLDTVKLNKSLNSSLTININENDLFLKNANLINVIEHENCDPRSPSIDFLRTPIEIIKKIDEIDINSDCEQVVPATSPSNSSESLLKMVTDLKMNISESHNKNSENNDILTNSVELKNELDTTNSLNTEAPLDVASEGILENNTKILDIDENVNEESDDDQRFTKVQPTINLTADVRDFDKKLSNLIYEDEDIDSYQPNITDSSKRDRKNRTPLAIRNISEPNKSRLKVSNKPRKSDYAISKIPVFHEKLGKKKVIQCENTPPTKEGKRRTKTGKSMWDCDNTLVI